MSRLTKYESVAGHAHAIPIVDADIAIQKLAEFENLEEQGKLLRLQFRVGDFVWDDEFESRYKITGYSFGTAEDYIDDPVSETEVIYYYTNYCGSITGSFSESEIGKTIFHFKEEAEAALEKMKGEEHDTGKSR